MIVAIARHLNCDALTGDAIVRAALSALAGQSPETSTSQINSVGRASHKFIQALAKSLEPADQT